MIFEWVIVCILLVFAAFYFAQQLRWANEQQKRIQRWEELNGFFEAEEARNGIE